MTTRTNRLKNTLAGVASEPASPFPKRRPSEAAAAIQGLFEVLEGQYAKEAPALDPVRRATLDDVMKLLKEKVTSESEEKTLDDMNADRGDLEKIVARVQPQGKRPNLRGPGAPAGSRSERLLTALQELKMFVWSAGMQQSARTGMRNAAIDLFPRLGRLTTWISEAGIDTAKVRQLEWDQARGLAHEVRLFARRAHVTLAKPVWSGYNALTEPNRTFFSGPRRVRNAFVAVAKAAGLETDNPGQAGADVADHRWRDLRAANVAVFDLSGADPQVYYELGIALTLGTQLLLVARKGTRIHFDVAQTVRFYEPTSDLREFLADELDGAVYGLPVRGGTRSSLDRTLAYAERLAAVEGADPLSPIALRSIRNAGADPVKFSDALTLFNGNLGDEEHDILLPRWPGNYPDPASPRCFAVMPFRGAAELAYPVIKAAAATARVEAVRGDVAEGQQMIESIWDEICRSTHVTVDLTDFNPNVCLELGIAHTLGRPTRLIGAKGTPDALKRKLPGAAKWRCHVYDADSSSMAPLRSALESFLARTETV